MEEERKAVKMPVLRLISCTLPFFRNKSEPTPTWLSYCCLFWPNQTEGQNPCMCFFVDLRWDLSACRPVKWSRGPPLHFLPGPGCTLLLRSWINITAAWDNSSQCQDYVLKCNLTEAACCTDQAQQLSWTEGCMSGREGGWMCGTSSLWRITYATKTCCQSKETKLILSYKQDVNSSDEELYVTMSDRSSLM